MSFETISNYYEHLVFEEVLRQLQGKKASNDYGADVACVALNHLPPRYIRHEVDLLFYLSPTEQVELRNKVSEAVSEAIKFIEKRSSAK